MKFLIFLSEEKDVSNMADDHILHTYTPNQCLKEVSTFYTLWKQRNSPDKILELMVTIIRSQVKLRSCHDGAHLQPQSNVPTKYHIPILYSFKDIACKKI